MFTSEVMLERTGTLDAQTETYLAGRTLRKHKMVENIAEFFVQWHSFIVILFVYGTVTSRFVPI